MNTYTLTRPVIVGNATYQELQLPEEILARHCEAMDAHKGEVRKLCALIASCCGIPLAAVREFPMVDLRAIGERLMQGVGADFFDQPES